MELNKNILLLGIESSMISKIQQAITLGLGRQWQIQFHIGSQLRKERAQLIANEYHMLVIRSTDPHEFIFQLKFIRLFDVRLQIICILNQEADFFMIQKYHISFVIREAYLTSDLQDLTYILCQLYQNKQFYLPYHQHFISIHSIYFIESSRNYTQFHCVNETWKERFTIKELAQQQAFASFLLISQSVLLHPLHIQSIQGEQITMKNGQLLFISRAKLHHVHQKLEEAHQRLLF